MRKLIFIGVLIGATSCGTDEPDAVPLTIETEVEKTMDAPEAETETVIAWPAYTCTKNEGVASAAQLADKRALNSIAKGDKLSTMIPEAKSILLDAVKTVYETFAVAGCVKPEFYTYRAYQVVGATQVNAFIFSFSLCEGAVEEIKYCPNVAE